MSAVKWVGKRVKVQQGFTTVGQPFIKNRVGTVLCTMLPEIEGGHRFLLVEMDAPLKRNNGCRIPSGPATGHDGNDAGTHKAADGHGWWLAVDKLEQYFEIIS